MKRIHFIFNPIAGKGVNIINEELLKKHFNSTDYHTVIKPTHYKKHAIKLTQESINEHADVIVACGGDGTINEVASCLVNTSIVLGIIPIGSGNGFASNLNISKNIDVAISIIKKHHIKKVDVGKINNYYFFSNTGIGFDAQVIKHYEVSKKRTLYSYFEATIKSFKNQKKLPEVETTLNNKTFRHKPFLLFVSNTNQMGYHISLTPKASLDDGFLDILISPKLGFFKTILFTVLMLFKKHDLLKEVETYQAKNLEIKQLNKPASQIQIDGEFMLIKNNTISVFILEKAINVLA